VESVGLQALNLTLDFSEEEVLRANLAYLIATLDLEGLELCFSTEAPEERIRDECCPGLPYAVYRIAPSVRLTVTNPQPSCGCFQLSLPVMEGDTTRRLAARIAKLERNVKDGSRVTLLRYTDPELGPRRIPVFDDPLAGREALADDVTFAIDLAAGRVTASRAGQPLSIGDELVYMVKA